MKLLVDENLPRALASVLDRQGHTVFTPPLGASDEIVARLAKSGESVLITLDKDFANILRYPPTEYYGIICLRIKPPIVEDIERALAVILEKFADSAIHGKLIVVSRAGYRIRM